MWEGFWWVGVFLHDGTGGNDDVSRSDVTTACKVGLFEVFEPLYDFIWFGVGKEQTDLPLE